MALSANALFATANTAMILLISTSRIVYGVSKAEYNSFPTVFATVHPRRQTPYAAVVLVALVTIPFAFVGDLGTVAELANLALLAVFVVVNASLLKLRYDGDAEGGRLPRTAEFRMGLSDGGVGESHRRRIGIVLSRPGPCVGLSPVR